MSAQQAIAREVSASFVGRVLEVLVERRATASERRQVQVLSWEHGLLRAADGGANQLRGTYYLARSQADAPEIDGRVYVQGRLPVGDFARVRVIGHTDYDLIARPV
jgi:ribosomal protein S12 methylthiotransferase